MEIVYERYRQWIWFGALLLLALLSYFVLADSAIIEGISQDTVQYLDEKKAVVTSLTAVSAAASVGVGIVPGGDGFSETIAELSKYFLLVFAAIWLQKYLIGVTAIVTFKILIPVALLALAGNLFLKKEAIKTFAVKLLLFALVFFFTIPSSIALSRQIERSHEDSIQQTIQEVEKSNQEVQEKIEENGGIVENIQETWDKLTGSVQEFFTQQVEEIKVQFSNMVDAIAVLIITTCVIPILVFAFLFWCIRLIFGLEGTIKINQLLPIKQRRSKL